MRDNEFLVTNKACIEKQTIPTEEEQERKDLNFLYQVTGQNLQLSNLKKELGLFLELTNYIFTDIKSISEAGKKLKKIEYNAQQKFNMESLYNNKVKCFNNNLDLFQKKLQFIKEEKKAFNDLYIYIKHIKKQGFLLNEKYDINENDMILDLEQIIIEHKWVKNFEELIDIKNKNFQIIKEKKRYKLKSDFYNYYNSKYVLCFKIKIKSNKANYNYFVSIDNELFEKVIKREEEKQFDEENKDLMLFYIKYIIYKFFKEEINKLRNFEKNESKENTFQYSGLTFTIKKYPFNINLICNYYDNLEIQYSISKIEREKYKSDNNYYFNGLSLTNKKEIFNDFEFKINNSKEQDFINCMIKSIKTFFSNLLYDIKFSKNIVNFVGEVKRNNSTTLENIIKNGIFVKNITNMGLIIIRHVINDNLCNLNDEFKNNIIVSSYPNINEGRVGKYKITYDNYENYMKITYILELMFDNELNLKIFAKEPYKNFIFSLDQGQTIYIEKGRINFNYFGTILSSVFTSIRTNNNLKYRFNK